MATGYNITLFEELLVKYYLASKPEDSNWVWALICPSVYHKQSNPLSTPH